VHAVRYYESPALRPSSVVDVVVPARQQTEANRLLEALQPAVRYGLIRGSWKPSRAAIA